MNANKTIVYAALLAATVMLAAAPTASADVVLKDHVSNSALWNNVGGFGNFDFSGSNNNDSVAATCFTSNGGMLTSISGIFYKAANGNPNGGTWSAFDFRFIFYNSVSTFQSDPFGGSYSHVFSQPSNADWLTPVGTWGNYDLFRFDFDLTGLGITTTAGALQMASLQSLGDGGSGGVGGMAFSTGGAGAIGNDFDWYRNNSMGWGPATFDSLGAPQDYGAFRVTATVPSPGALALMLSAASFGFSKRRRRI